MEEAQRGGHVLRQRVTNAIATATVHELAARGYAGTSMEAVARRAGVGKAALYRRWACKEDMVFEVIGQIVRTHLVPVPNTGSLHADLRTLLGGLRAQLNEPLVGRIVPGLLSEATVSEGFARELRTTVARPRRDAAATVLHAAIDRNELPDDLDIELGVDLLIAPLAFRILIMREVVDDRYLDTLARSLEAALAAADQG